MDAPEPGGISLRPKIRTADGWIDLDKYLRDVEPSELVMHPSLTRVIYPHGVEEYRPVTIWNEDGSNIERWPGGTIEVIETVDPDQEGPWRTKDGRIASLGLLL